MLIKAELNKDNATSVTALVAELNKDNATSAVTGFVNLLSVLLKLTNKMKINKEVIKGIKGISVVEFIKFPTKKMCIYLKILYYFDALFC